MTVLMISDLMVLHIIGSKRERPADPSHLIAPASIEHRYTFEMATFLSTQRDVADTASQSHPAKRKYLKEEHC